jgi:hypothetical protein
MVRRSPAFDTNLSKLFVFISLSAHIVRQGILKC